MTTKSLISNRQEIFPAFSTQKPSGSGRYICFMCKHVWYGGRFGIVWVEASGAEELEEFCPPCWRIVLGRVEKRYRG